MTTETAQRRLLEALAAVHKDPRADAGVGNPLASLAAGFEQSRKLAVELGQHSSAAVSAALIDLLEAVYGDLTTEEREHG